MTLNVRNAQGAPNDREFSKCSGLSFEMSNSKAHIIMQYLVGFQSSRNAWPCMTS